MGAVRRAIIWDAASRHAANAQERRHRARTWGPFLPEVAAAAEAEAEQWEQAMIADLKRLEEMGALPAAIAAVLRNKEFVKEVLAGGALDGVKLRHLDVVSLELVVARIRAALVEMVLLEQKAAQ